MKKFTGIALTALIVVEILALLMTAMPVSAQATYWDFECHSQTHPFLDQLTEAEIAAEYEAVNAAFQAHGYPTPTHTAYPYGRLDKAGKVIRVTKQYRLSGRLVSGIMSTYPVKDWYKLSAAQFKRNTRWVTVKGWIDDAIATNALLVILTHDVKDDCSIYGVTPAQLIQAVDYAVQKQNAGQLWVTTIEEAYNYWSTATQGKATCVFTFDDAFNTDYINVYTIFKARGVKGTSFITTGFIEEPGSLTWAQIAQMRAGT